MLSRGVALRPRRLTNCGACWTNMKGTGDEQSRELAFSHRDAFPGLDPAALFVARDRSRSTSRRFNEPLPTGLLALRGSGGCAGIDAGCAGGYILFPAALERSLFDNKCDGRKTGAHQDFWRRDGGGLGRAVSTFRGGHFSLASRSVVVGSGIVKSPLCGRVSFSGAGASQAIHDTH